ncbi:MAG: TonB-dependent receptor, partial [Pseudomonadota bacterium]
FETLEIFSVGDVDGGFGAVFLPTGSTPGIIPFPSETAGSVDDLDQTTAEFRVAYDRGGRVRAQGGVFYFSENVEISSVSFDSLAGNVENGSSERFQETDAIGVFGSVSIDVTDRLTVSGGLRYTDDEKDFEAERFESPVGAGPQERLFESAQDDQVSWDVSATYGVNDDVNVYARIARGFRAPSIQGRLLFGNELSVADSETVISYEGGVKSELLDGRVRANLGGFYYELNDQQLTSVGGVNNTVALFNADEGVGYGFEFDMEAAVTPNLVVTGGVSYNFTEIQDEGLEVPACASPCTILDPFRQVANPFAADGDGFDEIASVDGNAFPNAPRWIGNVTARYGVPFRGGEVYLYTDWAYKGSVNFVLYESVEFGEDGFWEGGLRLGYEAAAGWDVSAFGRNITGQDRLTGGIDFNNLTGFVNEPSVWGIEVGVEF